MYPFDRFSESAKHTLTVAQSEAEIGHHSYIGAEHLLLGLFLTDGSVARQALISIGFGEASLRGRVSQLQASAKPVRIQQIIPTSKVKQVIEQSFEVAAREQSALVDTGHMLIALTHVDDAIASPVLAEHGATRERVTAVVDSLRKDGVADATPPPHARPMRRYLYVPDANGVRIGIDMLFPAEYTEQQRSELSKRVEQAIRGGS